MSRIFYNDTLSYSSLPLNRAERRRRNKLTRKIYNSSPSMIHEKNYMRINCILCSTPMKTVHDTHCAFPLAKLQSAKEAQETEHTSRCCSKCNTDVMTARISMLNVDNESDSEISKRLKEKDPLEVDLNKLTSIYDSPQAQAIFAELNQDYYNDTDLGRDGVMGSKS